MGDALRIKGFHHVADRELVYIYNLLVNCWETVLLAMPTFSASSRKVVTLNEEHAKRLSSTLRTFDKRRLDENFRIKLRYLFFAHARFVIFSRFFHCSRNLVG